MSELETAPLKEKQEQTNCAVSRVALLQELLRAPSHYYNDSSLRITKRVPFTFTGLDYKERKGGLSHCPLKHVVLYCKVNRQGTAVRVALLPAASQCSPDVKSDLCYNLSPIVRDVDGDGRGPRTTPTGLVCRVFTGKPFDSREETIGAMNTVDFGGFPSPVRATATFAECIELLVDLELLLGFDLRLDLELLDCVVSLVSIGLEGGASSVIGGCTDNIDVHDICVAHGDREGIGDVGESAGDGAE